MIRRASPRVAVIGAGPGGLAGAMLLAQSGCDVTVFERHNRVGGRTTTTGDERFRFDLGPTFFLYPRVLEEIFAACGRDLRKEVELVRLDPQYHLVFEAGGELRATPDVARMREQLATLSPADAANFPRFLDDNRAKLDAFRPILESPFASPLDLLRPSLLKAAGKLRPMASVASDLSRYFKDPRVRLAFSFQSKYLGMSPFQCPSLFTILSFLEYEHGVWHPIGGCGAVTAAMARVCGDLGVDTRLGDPVEGLTFSGRRVTGVRTSRGEHPFDAVVINADFAAAMKRLVPDSIRRRWTDARLEGKKYSCSTFMLYLGVEGAFPDLEHHTVWLAKDYEENLRDIEHRHCLSAVPSFYVCNPSRTDPTLAPPGCSALYCLVPVSHRCATIDWSSCAAEFRELLLRQMKRIGVDVAGRVRFERMVTPHDWEVQHRIFRGATFNLAHNLGQMLHRRPNNRFEDLENVYLVGGGTHPGSGLPVIFESARISSRLLLEDHGLPFYWPGQTGEPAKYAMKHLPGAAAAPGRGAGDAADEEVSLA
jgi:phytoene desaturase